MAVDKSPRLVLLRAVALLFRLAAAEQGAVRLGGAHGILASLALARRPQVDDLGHRGLITSCGKRRAKRPRRLFGRCRRSRPRPFFETAPPLAPAPPFFPPSP